MVMPWQPIPSVTAPHYLDTNLNQVQKCINWYHQKTPDGYLLMSLQGYQLKGTVANNAACRGAKYDPASTLTFSVHGNTVYQINSGGTSSALTGTLLTSSGPVCIASGLSQVMIVDGTYGYIVNPNALTVTRITDSNFITAPFSCACYNGQFLVSSAAGDRWRMSAVDDGLTWTPLITGRCLTNGDKLVHIETVRDVVYFFGTNSIEPWYGYSIDPYLVPMTGATMPIGIQDKTVVARINDTILFHGSGEKSRGCFWKIDGGQLQKIVPPYLEDKAGAWIYGSPRSYAYQNDGGLFFESLDSVMANFPRLLYKPDSDTWGEFSSDRALYTVVNGFPDGTPPLGFSSTDGSVYWLGNSENPYNQNTSGNLITRTLYFKLDGGMSRTVHQGLRIELEAQHDSLSSYTLSMLLQKSDDAGQTFDSGITISKAITNGTSAQQVVLTMPPLGSFKAGRIYRATFAGPAARLIIRRAEGLVRVGRF